jgi:peptidoglycan/xylan/chitin deacetylase (PgdA/CDA1 family)
LKTVILAYHRVASLSTDPQLLAVSPNRFDEQMAALRQAFAPVSLAEAVASHRHGEPSSGVVLTFDDGYSDNLHKALPILERHEFPATVFVTSGYVGETREFWWDELERILLVRPVLPDTLRLRIADRDLSWDLAESARTAPLAHSWNLNDRDDPTPRHTVYRSLCGRLRKLAVTERECVLDDLRQWAAVTSEGRTSHRALTDTELRQLSKSDLVEIGAHTVEHPALAVLSSSDQATEVETSKRYLENAIGTKVAYFSYPFGRGRPPRMTYNRETVKLVERAGYLAACSLKPALRRHTSLYELPRLIVQDWDGDELIRRIRSQFRGLPRPRIATRRVAAAK